MNTPSESTALTLKDWNNTCEEIKIFAVNYYETLNSIKPIIVGEDDSPESNIYFHHQDITTLRDVAKKLNPEETKLCPNFVKLNEYVNQYITLQDIPVETWINHINQNLHYRDISSFMSTCNFFANNEKWQQNRNEKRSSQIVAERYSTTMLTSTGKLLVCGKNKYGQFGLGHNIHQNTFITCPLTLDNGEYVKHIAAGTSHTVILTTSDKLLVCGSNYEGQLGLGHNDDQNTFISCPLTLDNGEYVKHITAGAFHTVILTTSNKLLVCGSNSDGQLGLGHNIHQNTFIACPLTLDNGEYVKHIAAGTFHTVILTTRDKLLVCGSNSEGQLGLGHNDDQNTFIACPLTLDNGEYVKHIAAGTFHTVILTTRDKFLVCGSNSDGQLGLGHNIHQNTFIACPLTLDKDEYVKHITAGAFHTAILTTEDKLLVCGGNNDGQLGLGHNIHQNTFIACPLTLDNGEYVKHITAGAFHTVILTTNNKLLVCGSNSDGQLGLGHNIHQNTFTFYSVELGLEPKPEFKPERTPCLVQ